MGLMKAVLSLRHAMVPPNAHLRQVNARLPLRSSGAVLPTQRFPLPRGKRNLAGVSSFGFSGTNAHVLVEASSDVRGTAPSDGRTAVLALSAKTEPELASLAEAYARHLRAHPALDFQETCWTAATGRAVFPHRLAVVATSGAEAADALGAGSASPRVKHGRTPAKPLPVVFLFTGQGAQAAGMGRELYQLDATFRRELDRCAAVLDRELDRPLLEIMHGKGPSTGIHDTRYAQPALFALEWALAQMWRASGVEPTVVLGLASASWSPRPSPMSCRSTMHCASSRREDG